jgi:predicted amino acid racemase
MATLQEAAETLGGVEQVNAPGHTSTAVLPLLERAGATHGEPGHALTGTTPLAAREEIEEVPAYCMVSEVSHLDADRVTVFGGAFYPRGHALTGILEHDGRRRRLRVLDLPHDAIDYHRQLERDGAAAGVGDPVDFAHRFQAFTSRGRVAAVDGIGRGRPELIAVHDALGNPVPAGQPLPGAAP